MEQFLTLGSVLNHSEPAMSHLLPAAVAVAAAVASSSNSPPATRSASVSDSGPGGVGESGSYTINGAFTTGTTVISRSILIIGFIDKGTVNCLVD